MIKMWHGGGADGGWGPRVGRWRPARSVRYGPVVKAPTVSPTPLAASLDAACRRWSDRPAITFGDETISYAELWQRVSRLAASYLELGVRPGDRVVCQLPNGIDHVVAIGAAWTVGALHVGTDNDLTPGELTVLLDQVDARTLLYEPRADAADVPGAMTSIRSARPGTHLLVNAAAPPELGDHGVHRLGDLLHGDVPEGVALPPPADPDHTAVLHLTSGTTGRSKAVKETHTACWAKMQFFADAYRPGPDDVHLVFQPIAHVFGMRLALIPLLTGGRLVLLDRFSPDDALRLVSEQGVTVLPGMPTHFTLLLRALDPERHRVDTLRWAISAATALPAGLADEIHDRFGVEMMYVFGCAEGFTTRTTDRGEIARGSVGRTVFRSPDGKPQDGRVQIIDPADNRPLPAGEVGEIVFGAATPVRYWDDPDAATEGWYHTGDLGRIDPDGCLFVVGRLKELVNRGGLKVAPSEIEAAIVRHEAVADAGVVAAPDPVLGEAICACITPFDGAVPDLTELRAFLADLLARHKLPDELCVVPKIPRTKIGKVDRPVLTELVVHQEVPVQRWRPR
ncbi:MAG: AMP-binding protein [Pseudonocardiaceae bacterium]|nr:AMP-binding protein [Pseudonocardiaceae bacterium]